MADYLNYVLSNPDLRENAEALGLTQAEMKEWGKTHWDNHGSKEGADGGGRQNSPTATAYQPGFTETLGAQHYQGRDPNEVLQRSVRSFYQGADADDYNMWESREGIDAGWNLGQYNSQGWNMASDNPYKTGILGNTIEVNEGLGQLTPTAEGNLNFIQDRYQDDSLANDFLSEWVTDNKWTGPENLGGYWDDLTNATRNPITGDLSRGTPYDPNTALRPSTNVGPRGNPNSHITNLGLGGSTIGLQDWSRFGTNPTAPPPLQENNLANYQLYAGAPTGGTGVNLIGGGGSNNIWGDSIGGIDFNTSSSSSSGNNKIQTDAQGKTWIMSNGQWIPTTSDLGSILASGNTPRYPFGHYDSNGMWVGSEAGQGNETYGSGEGFGALEGMLGAGPSIVGDDPSY